MAVGTAPAFEPRLHKLSKPRTNASSTNLLKFTEPRREPSSPISPADSSLTGDQVTIVASPSGERRSRRRTRSRLRAYINGAVPDKSHQFSSDEEGERQRGLADVARGVKTRLSRTGTGSSISQSASAGASSIQFSNPSSSNVLLHESQPSDLDDLTRTALEIKEKAYTDSLAAQNHVARPLNENVHVDSVKSPIRRRSLYTPGIATRAPNDILQKPPPPDKLQSQADRDYYFNPNLPKSSPLAQLVALEIGEGGRSTPTNLNYSHIGGLKLGTLRVTNGAASPPPTLADPLRMHPPESKLLDYDEILTASETCQSHNDSRSSDKDNVGSTGFQRISEAQPQFSPHTTDVSRLGVSVDQEVRPRRSSSPLKNVNEPREETATKCLNYDSPRASRNTRASSSLDLFFKSPDRAVCMAQDYMQEFSDSPYSCAEPFHRISSNMDHIPKANSADKESSDDEGVVMSKSQPPVMGSWRSFIEDQEARHANDGTREDALRKLTARAAVPLESFHRPVSAISRESSYYNGDPRSDTTEQYHNADSGYSSSESLKPSNYLAIAGGKSEPILLNSNLPHLRASRCVSGPREMPRPVPRCTDSSSISDPSKSQDPGSLPLLFTPTTERISNPLATHTNSAKDPIDRQRPKSSISILSKTEARKLKKAKRLSQSISADCITVQCVRNLSQSNIPPVPLDIALKHSDRLRRFPQLEHTYPSLQHVRSDDSLSSEEPIVEPIRFPSPTGTLERQDSIIRSNLDWPSSRSVKKKKSKSTLRKSLLGTSKAERRKSQSEITPAIADFGTVTESLGGSPYDIARSVTPRPGSGSNNFISHPHQMSTSSPRPRTMIGMDEEVASEFARIRSRQRVKSCSTFNLASAVSFDDPVDESVDPPNEIFDRLRVPVLPRPKQLNRERRGVSKPRGPSHTTSDNHLGFSGKLKRTQSMFVDAPPVPELPTEQQVAQWEAQILTSNSSKSYTLQPPLQNKKPIERLKATISEKSLTTERRDKFTNRSEDWECYRLAWDQRRKSAGDALLLRFHALSNSKPSVLPNHSPNHPGHGENYLNTPAFSTHGSLESGHFKSHSIQPLSHPPPQPSKRPSQTGLAVPSPNFNIPRKKVAATAAAFENLTGRYTGGLSYGYEPGLGLGGSAGTRSVMTGASRKSVEVSRGFGIDLSDVPIFVKSS